MPFNPNTQPIPISDNDFQLADPAEAEREGKEKNEKLQGFFKKINSALGGTSVRVELTETDYNTRLDYAISTLRAISRRSVYETYGFLNLMPNIQTYFLHEAIDNVIQIYRKRSLFGSAGTGFDYFSQIAASLIYPGSQPGGYLGIASYDFSLQYENTLNRIFAREMQFKYRNETHTLYLEQNPKGPEFIVIRCVVLKTINELLRDHWAELWLRKYTTAHSKTILGMKRGKFGSLPGAQGGTQLDGATLIEKGEKEMLDLEVSVANLEDGGTPAYPIKG